MKVETVTLSPGQWEEFQFKHMADFPCREYTYSGGYRSLPHDWQLMQAPPDPIWFCPRCQRIEQRKLVEA